VFLRHGRAGREIIPLTENDGHDKINADMHRKNTE
jgi:hypothetical protein